MSIQEKIRWFSPIFELCTDVSVSPEINHRKAAKAISKYGDSNLDPDDVLLLAGKGHETGQTVAGVTHPFDDGQVAARILAEGRP